MQESHLQSSAVGNADILQSVIYNLILLTEEAAICIWMLVYKLPISVLEPVLYSLTSYRHA
jgi:hypothetical protein